MNVFAQDYNRKPQVGGPFGNAFHRAYKAAGAPANGEKFYLGVIPAGTEVSGFSTVYDDFGTAITFDYGFEPVDPVVGPAANATYWFNALDVATAAGRAQSVAKPVRFNTAVKLVVTVHGTISGSPEVYSVVSGESLGPL
jgi:hypothetical protein